ncbi:VCBS repeat-containing protein [Fulvivirgaceae bacterium BMA12]|uniref:VCBS repeat-containing protein n=1 Tax=Agaribacillus aureus TaxID=3051825 RepID=A0ABT8L7K5_9BACT|nr:VCBS repeat-containing protein [Fulvivirgaceae bacterium BMA12]
MMRYIGMLTLWLISWNLCGQHKKFQLLPSSVTNIRFTNWVEPTARMNVFISPYFYNGGGVAVGDINNDGLSDIFFVANFGPDKLYLNKGDMIFEDISLSANVIGVKSWETGVTMCDINNDGWLDIYVSRSGLMPDTPSQNLLYVNNKDNTFTEQASVYGLADISHTTQASFFDYDLDGDLDVFLLNHNVKRITPESMTFTFRDIFVGDKLYRNDEGKFTDVSEEAGILGSTIGYGLGVMIGDVNQDGWPDVYVSNDYIENDYLYINNGNGSFSECIKEQMPHIPLYSMGGDMADFNNDGLLDLMTLDMTAEDNFRQKANMAGMDPEKFWATVNAGKHYQYMVNCLQLNNGKGSFSDVAAMAGVSYSDWSWGAVFADFDNDGLKDQFITNGYRVTLSKDFINWYKEREKFLSMRPVHERDYAAETREAMNNVPSEKVKNYMFRNKGNLSFEPVTESWGLDEPSFSNGFAHADLDNDGDLDLVLNNLDHQAFVYENMGMTTNNYLRIKFQGPAQNKLGLGAKVTVRIGSREQFQEHYITRGYQSSVEPVMHFGLGHTRQIDEIEVIWFDGKVELLKNVKPNRLLTLSYTNAAEPVNSIKKPEANHFREITGELGIDFRHIENEFDDFEEQILLPHKLSQFGPALAVSDVNGDGLDDFYVGGARGQAGVLYFQGKDGRFSASTNAPWQIHDQSEDLDALFFDADTDGDPDLYVVSGGNEYEINDTLLQDRLYLNNGLGAFTYAAEALPAMLVSGGVVKAGDLDGDGDPDLFVGGRLTPGQYPRSPRSYILENNMGVFTDITAVAAPSLNRPGMITDATWSDFNGDNRPDLVVVGEWMPVHILLNKKGKLEELPFREGFKENTGWWFSVTSADMDGDGDMDLIAGNLGNNYKYQANKQEPFNIYAKDFDQNGRWDIVLGYYNDHELYPVRGLQCSSQQIPGIQRKFNSYNAFAGATLMDIYEEMNIDQALKYSATNFSSSYIENLGDGKFNIRALPPRAQLAPVNDIIIEDFDDDKHKDILLAGNLYGSEVETPRADAGTGLLLRGDGQGNFSEVPPHLSGLLVNGNVKKMRTIQLNKWGKAVLVAVNNQPLRVIALK